jgi:hypothetical protein
MQAMRRNLILLCALAGLLAAGCAAGDDAGGAGNAPVTTPTPAPSVTPSPPPAGPTVTLVGEVQVGVEAGCLVLQAERGGTWLLLGGDRSVLKAGARVEVTGSEARDIATTCQQGRPFQVTSARPA